jgi:hypothetical protein
VAIWKGAGGLMCKSARNTGGNLVATLDLDPVAEVQFAPVCTAVPVCTGSGA